MPPLDDGKENEKEKKEFEKKLQILIDTMPKIIENLMKMHPELEDMEKIENLYKFLIATIRMYSKSFSDGITAFMFSSPVSMEVEGKIITYGGFQKAFESVETWTERGHIPIPKISPSGFMGKNLKKGFPDPLWLEKIRKIKPL